MRNAFNALCELASINNWCWNIYCTTCGHSLFKASFNELIKGKHPDQKDWILTDWNSLKTLKHPYPKIQNWIIDQQKTLAVIISNSSMVDLSLISDSTDWLGYLGLGLKYSKDFEHKTKQITLSIIPQLIEMIGNDENVETILYRMLEVDGREIRWTDLELIEKLLLRKNLR
jgi:hypothetical protein